jgi:hypothetical protein
LRTVPSVRVTATKASIAGSGPAAHSTGSRTGLKIPKAAAETAKRSNCLRFTFYLFAEK